MIDFARIIALILSGASTVDAQIAEGDRRAADLPELAPLWAEIRAKLLAMKNDHELQNKVAAGVVEMVNTFLQGHGEVGPSQAHHG